MIVLHYTGMPTGEAALARLRDPAARSRPTTWSRRTAASSRSCPRSAAPGTPACRSGRASATSTASRSAIEIVNPGHEFGYRPFPDAQIERRDRAGRRHPYALEHRRRAHPRPLRRRAGPQGGSGRALPLEAAGRGRPRPLGRAGAGARRAARRRATEGTGVFALQAGPDPARLRLRAVRPSTTRRPPPSSRAFQRHWRPDLVDGVADGETRARLIALLRLPQA